MQVSANAGKSELSPRHGVDVAELLEQPATTVFRFTLRLDIPTQ